MIKKILVGIAGLLAVIVVVVITLYVVGQVKVNSALAQVHDFPPINIADALADVSTGERIANVRNGCFHCHGGDFGGKIFIEDPMMGTIGGGNLTPVTLASWSDEEIARAIRYGVRKDNKPLLFMPSHEFQYLGKNDLASVVAYLRSLPAVDRPSPVISLGVMGKILYGVGQLPTLIPAHSLIKAEADFVAKPEEASTAAFGKYLVSASCTGCHGPALEGGPIPGAPPSWPPASKLKGITAAYSMDEFMKALRDRVKKNGEAMKQPMSDAPTQLMTDVELEAIWKYLDTVK